MNTELHRTTLPSSISSSLCPQRLCVNTQAHKDTQTQRLKPLCLTAPHRRNKPSHAQWAGRGQVEETAQLLRPILTVITIRPFPTYPPSTAGVYLFPLVSSFTVISIRPEKRIKGLPNTNEDQIRFVIAFFTNSFKG